MGLGAFTSKPRDFPSRKVYGDRNILPRDPALRDKLIPRLRDERIFFIRHALRAGFTIEEIFNLTKIDRWFLVQIKEIVDFEEELAGRRISKGLSANARASTRTGIFLDGCFDDEIIR